MKKVYLELNKGLVKHVDSPSIIWCHSICTWNHRDYTKISKRMAQLKAAILNPSGEIERWGYMDNVGYPLNDGKPKWR